MSDYTVDRGETLPLVLTVSNLTATGLTGYDFTLTVKADRADPDEAPQVADPDSLADPACAYIHKHTSDFAVRQSGDAVSPGILDIDLDTADLPAPALLSWDVWAKMPADAEGKRRTFPLDSGILTVLRSVTRSV